MNMNNAFDTTSNVDPYRRRAALPPACAPTSLGGMHPGATQGLADASSALKALGPGGSSLLKRVQLPMTITGGVLVTLGVGMLIFVGVGSGASMIGTGLCMIFALRFAPSFLGMDIAKELGEASAVVDELTAKAQLAQNGIPAQARIVSMRPTGAMINYNPQVQASLEVQGPSGPYLVHTLAVISQMYIPQFQPGATVMIRVNPQNPQDVAVVF